MPSKTSFCNGAEFRKCLSRWWPLWVIYGVILFIMLPGVLLNARSTTPYVSTEQIGYLSNMILSETQMLLPLTAFCAGLLAAAAMFGYLYTPRGAGLAASLPIRRGCMFRTHLLAGLLMLLSAEVVVFGLAVLIEAVRFTLVIQPLLIWLGVLALETVIFYAIAVLCAMLTGHTVLLPCLYLLVNFVAVGFQVLIDAVLYTFVYGMSGMVDLPVDWLSPLVLFMRRTSISNDYLLRPISGTGAEQRHGGRGRRQQFLRLDLSARLGGVRAAAARVRGAALPPPPHGERGRHGRHPGAQAGAEIHRGALCRVRAAGRRVQYAAQRAGLPDASAAVSAADDFGRGARLCHQRDDHPQIPAHPEHGLARLRGHGGRLLPDRRGRQV